MNPELTGKTLEGSTGREQLELDVDLDQREQGEQLPFDNIKTSTFDMPPNLYCWNDMLAYSGTPECRSDPALFF